MTAQDLHIDFDINLQKISSNVTRNIEPEEIDWLLNKEVPKFLNKRTTDKSDPKRRGFEEDTKRLKDVAPLIKTVTLDVEQIEDKKGKVILPSFNFKDVKASAVYYKDCEASEGNELELTVNVFKFKLPTDFVEPLKVVVTSFGQPDILYSTANLPNTYIGGRYTSLLKSFEITIRKALLTSFYSNIKIYFEWFGEQYEENTYFIVGTNKLGNVQVFGDGENIIYPVVASTFKRKKHTSTKQIKKPIRLISTESADWKEDSFLSGSIAESPIMELTKGNGFIQFPPNAIVKQVIFTYIERPTLIDIYLGTSLNLDTDICSEIVIQTVRFTKALLDSGNYEKYFNETNLIE